MLKKVPVSQLHPGMFVADFNHPNLEHPFFAAPRLLKEDREVLFMASQGIKEVYIDVSRGRDAHAPTRDEVDADIAAQIAELGEDEGQRHATAAAGLPRPQSPKEMQEELSQASQVKSQARRMVGNLLEDARLGKQVTAGPVRAIVSEMAESMFRNPSALLSLSQIKQKDEYTFMHSVNVGVFLMSFCQGLELEASVTVDVGVGAMLHDIGKMKTPPEVLNKNGRLTNEEFAIMRNHVVYSAEILSQSPGFSQTAIHVAGQHHERFDGSGYPHGLKGDEISLYGQMAAIVDVYDAITSDRCYHKGMTPHEALKKMLEWSQYHFKPELYQSFVRVVGIYPMGTFVRLENGLLGVVLESNRGDLLYPSVRVLIDSKNKRQLAPKTVDLSAYKDYPDKGFRIIAQEPHVKWGVDPKKHLPQAQLYQ
ncbi:MAG: HD-GYP domain-containing protein [Magnetococcus sp. WYHC-3]